MTIIKFSPDNNMLAITGYNIFDIQILQVERKRIHNFGLIRTDSLYSVVSIDWSANSAYIQVNNIKNEFHVYNSQTFKEIDNLMNIINEPL
jgi:hypothetical protein